jgi:hypothetical protein
MDEPFGLYRAINLVITVLLILVCFGVIGVVLLRFKTTIAGILLMAGYGGCTLTILLMIVAARLVEPGGTASMVVFGLSDVLDFIFTILIAVGIFLIPRSLRIIKQSSQ